MLPYALVFALIFFLALRNKPYPQKTWYYFVISVFTLFAGFRDMIGGYDVYIYAAVYEATKEFILGYDAFDYGYRLLYLFLRLFSEDRHFMFFMVGMLYYVVQAYVIKKHSPLFYLSLFIIFCKFYLMSFVYLRQELAMVVCWLSIPYILDRKYIKFFGLMAVAFLFHKSALLFLPLYFIAPIKFPKLGILLISVVTLFLSLTPLSDFLLEQLISDTEALARVEKYYANSTGVNPFYLIEAGILIFILLYYKSYFYSSKHKTLIANGFFLYILVTLFSVKNGAFIRFNWYYLFFIAVGLTYPILATKGLKTKGLIKFGILLYFSLLFFRSLTSWDAGDLMPYKTIFEDYDRDGMHDDMEYRLKKKTYGF
jgi:hypothetical protein